MERHLWWQKGIIYLVYPASFMDANAERIGRIVTGEIRMVGDEGLIARVQ